MSYNALRCVAEGARVDSGRCLRDTHAGVDAVRYTRTGHENQLTDELHAQEILYTETPTASSSHTIWRTGIYHKRNDRVISYVPDRNIRSTQLVLSLAGSQVLGEGHPTAVEISGTRSPATGRCRTTPHRRDMGVCTCTHRHHQRRRRGGAW